jgi:DnaJ-domain-containing protein 1
LKVIDRVQLQRLHHVRDKPLRVKVDDFRLGVSATHGVTNSVHQVRFAEPDTTIQKQGVVRQAGVLGDLLRSRKRQLITLALNESLKSVAFNQTGGRYERSGGWARWGLQQFGGYPALQPPQQSA